MIYFVIKYIFKSSSQDVICQITIMFWMKEEDKIPLEICKNNNFPRVVDRYVGK